MARTSAPPPPDDIESLVEQGATEEIERLRYNLTCIVNADYRVLYDESGTMLPPHRWPDDIMPAIKRVMPSYRGGDPTIEFQDRNAAITQLAKLGGLYNPAPVEEEIKNPLEELFQGVSRKDLKRLRTEFREARRAHRAEGEDASQD